MRAAIISEVYNVMKANKNSYFLTGDLGFNTVEKIEETFKERFINIGVAEQNMIGIAAGLALSGKKVFCYSIIPFLTMRCFEQIRNDICFHDLDVTLLGAGSGLSYGILSSTHFALEDMAILRTLPHMTIFSPADEIEARLGMQSLAHYHHPTYVRIGLRTEPIVYTKEFPFVLGKGNVLQHGKDIAVYVTGNIMDEVIKACRIIETKTHMSCAIIDIHTVKPLDEEMIHKTAQSKKIIFTVEEHGQIGGLGDAVLSVLSGKGYASPIVKIGTNDMIPKVLGDRTYLRKKLGLDSVGIAKRMYAAIH